ncbi:hypothetical protein [Planktothricoides raciborskii]|uniref:Uncharacterized protein n=1 Tax=Planktothricoides raciborskii GIHE-MW2 TaxID=2792601 RepID=A0AAU8JM84_9CYAN
MSLVICPLSFAHGEVIFCDWEHRLKPPGHKEHEDFLGDLCVSVVKTLWADKLINYLLTSIKNSLIT